MSVSSARVSAGAGAGVCALGSCGLVRLRAFVVSMGVWSWLWSMLVCSGASMVGVGVCGSVVGCYG